MTNKLLPITLQKTPATQYDVEIDWSKPSRQLGDDTVAESTWAISGPDSALELYQPSIAADSITTGVWLRGGTLGAYYTVTNTIISEGGRTLEESFIVQMVESLFMTQSRYL